MMLAGYGHQDAGGAIGFTRQLHVEARQCGCCDDVFMGAGVMKSTFQCFDGDGGGDAWWW